jgi:hypothetical protein
VRQQTDRDKASQQSSAIAANMGAITAPWQCALLECRAVLTKKSARLALRVRASLPDTTNEGTTVNNLKINVIVLALGLAFSAGSMAAGISKAAHMKTSDARATASEKSANAYNKADSQSADAQKDATADKAGAEYAVAKEKCDDLAGNAKDVCVKEARARFGKS